MLMPSRITLRVIMKLLLLVILLSIAWVTLSFVRSNAGSEAGTESMQIRLGGIPSGGFATHNWDGKAVLVLRRSTVQLQALAQLTPSMLVDPDATSDSQPAFAKNLYRSLQPEWFVAIAHGTDLGCPIRYLPADGSTFLGHPWAGGFSDSCGGSRYDLAGRVYVRQNANRNLRVPDYRIKGDVLYLGG